MRNSISFWSGSVSKQRSENPQLVFRMHGRFQRLGAGRTKVSSAQLASKRKHEILGIPVKKTLIQLFRGGFPFENKCYICLQLPSLSAYKPFFQLSIATHLVQGQREACHLSIDDDLQLGDVSIRERHVSTSFFPVLIQVGKRIGFYLPVQHHLYYNIRLTIYMTIRLLSIN